MIRRRAGAEHGVAIDNIGTVYTFGASNSHLQLGTQVGALGGPRAALSSTSSSPSSPVSLS
jgi:hypothetical protein